MSLTSQLETAGSPINLFFKKNFPKITEFTKRERPAINKMKTLIPPTSGNNPRLIGTAFDYRLRMHLAGRYFWDEKILEGLQLMQEAGSGNKKYQDDKWAETTREQLSEILEGEEQETAKKSLILGYLDAGLRSGGKWPKTLIDLAGSIKPKEILTKKKYLASIPNQLSDEIQTLIRGAEPEFPMNNTEIVLGPTFTGSQCAGGADADIILDGCLYDIKTTANPNNNFPDHIRQILGYLLLDWDNTYEIKQVGFYFSRQCRKISWDAEHLISQTTTEGKNIDNLKKELEETLSMEEMREMEAEDSVTSTTGSGTSS